MATAVIIDTAPIVTKRIKDDGLYKTVKINYSPNTVKIKEVLPFRIKFTAIGIEGTGPGNVLPIPLQVIGYSNYIL
jgi:hypothetical protein